MDVEGREVYNQYESAAKTGFDLFMRLCGFYPQVVFNTSKHGDSNPREIREWQSLVTQLFYLLRAYEKELVNVDILKKISDYDSLLQFTEEFLRMKIFQKLSDIRADMDFETALLDGYK